MVNVIGDFQKSVDRLIGTIARAAQNKPDIAKSLFEQLGENRAMWQREAGKEGTAIKEGSISRGYRTMADTGSTRELAKQRVAILNAAIRQLEPLMKKIR